MNIVLFILYAIIIGISIIIITYKPKYNLVILGGGVSGLTILDYCLNHNIKNVLLIDAEEKVGGRIKSKSLTPDTIVNIGAKWIQGSNNNEFFNKYVKDKIKYVPSDFDDLMIYDSMNKSVIYPSDTENDQKLFDHIVSIPNDYQKISVKAFLELNNFNSMKDVKKFVIEKKNIDNEFGEDSKTTSLKNIYPNYMKKDFGNDNLLIVEDFCKIFENFTKNKEKYIKTNEKVLSINYNNETNIVTTSKGVYKSKYVICTFSVGVLKYGDIKFEPPLPFIKREAISRMDMVNYQTVFVEFDDIYWDNNHEFIGFFNNYNEFVICLNLCHKKYKPYYNDKKILVFLTYENIGKTFEYDSEHENIDYIFSIVSKSLKNVKRESIINILVPRWESNKNFYGTFSNWSLDFDRSCYDTLKSKLNNLYFAGEHTHYKYNGYIQGAYYSAIDTISKIVF